MVFKPNTLFPGPRRLKVVKKCFAVYSQEMEKKSISTIRITSKAARLIAGKDRCATIYLAMRPAVNG